MRALLFSLVAIILSGQALATGWQYNNNRFAISADGNNQADFQHKWPRADPDDWGGTPVALAIIAKKQAHKNLVHYSYNNFIDAPPHTTETNEMAIGVNGAIKHWGFNPDKFFDVSHNSETALEHLKAEIAKSTKQDPLYFIHMGPTEFFYRAVQRVIKAGKADSLSHVYVISHSGYNNQHLRRGDPKFDKSPVAPQDKHHKMSELIELTGYRINFKQIQDQNAQWDPNKLWSSEHDWSVWAWMKDHKDPSVQWLYERMLVNAKGVADCSDAGMVYYLLTGDDNGSPAKLQAFIGEGIKA
ncbi:hypothetical protein C2869_04050 [Saccharobesus litoralis]|uniref:Uncharacterized protein n=1 Tax=Saccharobesus litoralis TaxID=2172099 RepID=A0A2S0VNA8_9ALTE|nr:hypothetical protein [Saccharobesus litoralis]AWB65659.1 hypothetical protein C2869_04050 [Saccharobesus litoralis]